MSFYLSSFFIVLKDFYLLRELLRALPGRKTFVAYSLLAFLPVPGVFLIQFVPNINLLTAGSVALAFVIALVNGYGAFTLGLLWVFCRSLLNSIAAPTAAYMMVNVFAFSG